MANEGGWVTDILEKSLESWSRFFWILCTKIRATLQTNIFSHKVKFKNIVKIAERNKLGSPHLSHTTENLTAANKSSYLTDLMADRG